MTDTTFDLTEENRQVLKAQLLSMYDEARGERLVAETLREHAHEHERTALAIEHRIRRTRELIGE